MHHVWPSLVFTLFLIVAFIVICFMHFDDKGVTLGILGGIAGIMAVFTGYEFYEYHNERKNKMG